MTETTGEIPAIIQAERQATPKPPETKPANEKPLGREEQQIVNRINQDGDPDKVLKDIADKDPSQQSSGKNEIGEGKLASNEVTIDMVKGPDGKWTTRALDDPNFLYTPKLENQSSNLRPPSTEQTSTEKSKDAWPQWQAGEAQRNSQYQQFNQAANEAWANFQQTGEKTSPNTKAHVASTEQTLRPANGEAPPNFNTQQESKDYHERISPKDKWKMTEQRNQQRETKRQQELQNLQNEGARLANLVYTPEGQQQITETRARLSQVVEATLKKPRMETVHPGFDRSPDAIETVRQRNEHLKQAWRQSAEARIDRLLKGESMNNLEEKAYLTQILGHEPLTTTNIREIKQTEVLIAQFERQRRDIGRALLYQSSDTQDAGQRYLLISETRLRFYGISTEQAQEIFARGWDEVKNYK